MILEIVRLGGRNDTIEEFYIKLDRLIYDIKNCSRRQAMKKIGMLLFGIALIFMCSAFVASEPRFKVEVRNTNKPKIEQSTNNQLWIIRSNGKEEMAVESKDDKSPQKLIAGISSPLISPDGRRIYFISDAWATSGAIHVYDVKTKKEKFICPGNTLQVVKTGKYKGDIIVNQHRYYGAPNYGSYDHFYLVTPSGNVVKDLGEEVKNIE
jgi:dipeptidyl aminopeptidase/acylaminoacyl peptidase